MDSRSCFCCNPHQNTSPVNTDNDKLAGLPPKAFIKTSGSPIAIFCAFTPGRAFDVVLAPTIAPIIAPVSAIKARMLIRLTNL